MRSSPLTPHVFAGGLPSDLAWSLFRAAARPLRWLTGGSLVGALATSAFLAWPTADDGAAARRLARATSAVESASTPARALVSHHLPPLLPQALREAVRGPVVPAPPPPLPHAEHGLEGGASYYAAKFEGRRTASGEPYRGSAMTAAHRTLPFGTRVRVTSERTGRSVVVRINDRGPFHTRRVIDLSRTAASRLGMLRRGRDTVRLEVLDRG
jgi:rare lipoprotein A